MGQKKRYHVVRKNKADTRALFRLLLCGYLLYLEEEEALRQEREE